MHSLHLSKRNADAQDRLLKSTALLARFFHLDPSLLEALKPTSKDADVRALQEREGIADLLDAIVSEIMPAPDMPEPNVTAVTETAALHVSFPLAPFEEQILQADALTQEVLTDTQEAALPDDLPAPVIEETVTEPAPEEPAIEETVDDLPAAIEEPVVEDTPAEETAPVKTSKKNTSKKPKK